MADLTPAPAYQADGEQAFSICDPKPASHVRQLIEHSPIASVVSNPRLPDNPLVAGKAESSYVSDAIYSEMWYGNE